MRHDSVVSRYVIPIGIPQVDGWSTRPPGFGASRLGIRAQVYEHLGLGEHGFRSWHLWCISCWAQYAT